MVLDPGRHDGQVHLEALQEHYEQHDHDGGQQGAQIGVAIPEEGVLEGG